MFENITNYKFISHYGTKNCNLDSNKKGSKNELLQNKRFRELF